MVISWHQFLFLVQCFSWTKWVVKSHLLMIWYTGVVKRMIYMACFRCFSWFCEFVHLNKCSTWLLQDLLDRRNVLDGLAPSKSQTSTSMSKFGAVWGCTKPGRCAAVVAAEGGIFLVAFFRCLPTFFPFGFPHFPILYKHALPLSSVAWAYIESILPEFVVEPLWLFCARLENVT